MIFRGNDGTEIHDLREWEEVGGPKESYQWKEGRSALELARCWISGEAQPKVESLLERQFAEITLEFGIAEKQTRFDSFSGPRHHDLLVEAISARGKVIIGVEGKADEPFDLSLFEKKAKTEKDLRANRNSKSKRRLVEMTECFLGISIDELEEGDPRGELGYQLLSALAGTLADAKLADSGSAVLLIHEFVSSETDDAKHEINDRVYSSFVDLVTNQAPRTILEPHTWVTTPTEISGYGELMPKALPVAFAKLTTKIR